MNGFTAEILNDTSSDPAAFFPATVFTQSSFYIGWQKAIGRKVLSVLVKDASGQPIALANCILFPLFFSKVYGYIPYGPIVKQPISAESMRALCGVLAETFSTHLRSENTVFVRFDFSPALDASSQHIISGLERFVPAPRYTYSSGPFQPRTDWILDLRLPEEELLAGLHQKHRYLISLAERRGVTIEIIDADIQAFFEEFYTLISATAKRDGFHLHPKSYYQAVFADIVKRKIGFLVIARLEKTILSIHLVLGHAGKAMFLFGGTSDVHRNLGASHLAHWRAIVHAKRLGFDWYNFGGITSVTYPRKTWQGITAFKQKFGGRELVYSPFFDLVLEPSQYRIFLLRKWVKRYFGI